MRARVFCRRIIVYAGEKFYVGSVTFRRADKKRLSGKTDSAVIRKTVDRKFLSEDIPVNARLAFFARGFFGRPFASCFLPVIIREI